MAREVDVVGSGGREAIGRTGSSTYRSGLEGKAGEGEVRENRREVGEHRDAVQVTVVVVL